MHAYTISKLLDDFASVSMWIIVPYIQYVYNKFCLEHVFSRMANKITVGEGTLTRKAIPNVHIVFIMIFMEDVVRTAPV